MVATRYTRKNSASATIYTAESGGNENLDSKIRYGSETTGWSHPRTDYSQNISPALNYKTVTIPQRNFTVKLHKNKGYSIISGTSVVAKDLDSAGDAAGRVIPGSDIERDVLDA